MKLFVKVFVMILMFASGMCFSSEFADPSVFHVLNFSFEPFDVVADSLKGA